MSDASDTTASLLAFIRNQFYAGEDRRFFQDRSFLLRAVTWPAAWLKTRGVSLQPKRYEQLMLEIFRGIQHHGQTDAIKYWPGYLLHVIQEHFKHHEEEIYAEAKALRTCLDRVFLGLETSKGPTPKTDQVEVMAKIHQVVAPKRRPGAARRTPQPQQMSLF